MEENEVIDNLKTLGIAFGDLPKPGGSYVAVNIRANIAYVAIQFPIKEGKFLFTGRLGKDLQHKKVMRLQDLLQLMS